MVSFSRPSFPGGQSGVGGHKAPPAGYNVTSDGKPAGAGTVSVPTDGEGIYKGVHVAPIGSTGSNTISSPKSLSPKNFNGTSYGKS